MRRRFPELPLICDPSHLGGDKKYIYEIAAKALGLGYDGLMIETHPNPAAALSDAKQQITSDELLDLLHQLSQRSIHSQGTISTLRDSIDTIDDHLLEMIEQRMEIAKEIGKIKKDDNQQIIQIDRWSHIINRLTLKGNEKGLSDVLIKHIFNAIHEESIKKQAQIIN